VNDTIISCHMSVTAPGLEEQPQVAYLDQCVPRQLGTGFRTTTEYREDTLRAGIAGVATLLQGVTVVMEPLISVAADQRRELQEKLKGTSISCIHLDCMEDDQRVK
jgi:hypothetical protein